MEPDPPFRTGSGLRRVVAYAAGMPLPPIGEDGPAPLWSWEAPADLRDREAAWGGRGRFYAAICWDLRPSSPEKEHGVTLVTFDARSGVRWRREVPLAATLSELRLLPDMPDGIRPHLLVSAGGNRIVLLLSVAGGTLTFLFDGNGTLLRRSFIPHRGISFARYTAAEDRHLLDFRTKDGTETYLADAEGNLRVRFARSPNQNSAATTLSKDGQFAGGFGWDGKYYLFQVPTTLSD
jgi:hypothetical protein